jgi:hypothetical protein
MDSPIRISTPGVAAHARYYGCFSLLKPVCPADDASPPRTRDRSDALDTSLNWCQLNWLLIRHHLWDADDVALMSGDHVEVTKAGKTTYGLDRFFSSLYGKAVPGLCFLTLSLLSTKRRASYPVVTEQVDKGAFGDSYASRSRRR